MGKLLEVFDWDFQPKLDRAVVLELAALDFVRRCEDVVITGKSGTGKSHILKAFGLRACEQSISVRYARCVDLLDDLHAALGDGTYQRRLRAWARPQLLIIDDVGLGQLRKREDEPTAAHTLFNLGLDIHLARISIKGDQIADIFYVRDMEGQKVKDKKKVQEDTRTILHQLNRL